LAGKQFVTTAGPEEKRVRREADERTAVTAPSQMALYVKRLSDAATLPVRASAGAAGYDLFWCAMCRTRRPPRPAA
jgi:hypothetical protein